MKKAVVTLTRIAMIPRAPQMLRCSTVVADRSLPPNRKDARITDTSSHSVRAINVKNPYDNVFGKHMPTSLFSPADGFCFTCGPYRPASALQAIRTSGRSIIDAREGEPLLPLTTAFQQGKPASELGSIVTGGSARAATSAARIETETGHVTIIITHELAASYVDFPIA